MITVIWLVLALVSAAGFHLASAHQHLWPALRARAGALRIAALVAHGAAIVAAIVALGPWAGFFAALTAWMLALVALPYADAGLRLRRRRRHVG